MDFAPFRESERQGWNDRAAAYANATARATCQTIPTLLAHARLFPDAKVLDAGCGPGYVAAAANLLGAKPEGIDFAPEMVAQAQRAFPHISFSVADVESLPFSSDTYDSVLSNIVLFHITDPKAAFAEAHRVLKPGGRFVFSQWLGPDKSACYKLLFDVLKVHADMSRADPAPDAYALSNEETVRDLMNDTGFDGVEFEVVENVLHAPGPSFFDFFMQFGVRVPLILERQEPDVQSKIRTEIDARAEPYLSDGIYRIPMPSLVVSGHAAYGST